MNEIDMNEIGAIQIAMETYSYFSKDELYARVTDKDITIPYELAYIRGKQTAHNGRFQEFWGWMDMECRARFADLMLEYIKKTSN